MRNPGVSKCVQYMILCLSFPLYCLFSSASAGSIRSSLYRLRNLYFQLMNMSSCHKLTVTTKLPWCQFRVCFPILILELDSPQHVLLYISCSLLSFSSEQLLFSPACLHPMILPPTVSLYRPQCALWTTNLFKVPGVSSGLWYYYSRSKLPFYTLLLSS
jgi:hypothetical protein